MCSVGRVGMDLMEILTLLCSIEFYMASMHASGRLFNNLFVYGVTELLFIEFLPTPSQLIGQSIRSNVRCLIYMMCSLCHVKRICDAKVNVLDLHVVDHGKLKPNKFIKLVTTQL